MILEQHDVACLGRLGYFVGDQCSRTAAVVDPRPDAAPYLDDARKHGCRVTNVILTAWHPDTAAAALELRRRTGARVSVSAYAAAGYPFVPVRHGAVITVGAIRFAVLETFVPTPDAIALLVFDASDGRRARAAFTGTTLLIGDVGRPALPAWGESRLEEAAGALYDSLHDALLSVPDEALVYSSQAASTVCGCAPCTGAHSTIGAQRRYNFALQPIPRAEFVRMIARVPRPASTAPPRDLASAAVVTTAAAVARWSLSELVAAQHDGVQVVDVRPPADFASAHLAQSLNVMGDRLGCGVEDVLEKQRPVALIAEPETEHTLACAFDAAGYHVVATLDGGPRALVARPDLIRRTMRIAAPTLAEQLAGRRAPLVIDTRSEEEWRAERIAGSICVPLDRLRDRIHLLPDAQVPVLVSGAGYRSSAATSVLHAHGITQALDLVAGMTAWNACRLPTVGDAAARVDAKTTPAEIEPHDRTAALAFEQDGALCVDLNQPLRHGDGPSQ